MDKSNNKPENTEQEKEGISEVELVKSEIELLKVEIEKAKIQAQTQQGW